MPDTSASADAGASPETPDESDRLDSDQTPDQKADDQTPEDESGSGDDDPLAITKFFDEQEGFRDAGQFRNDQEWLHAVGELKRKVGQRDDDAKLGRQLRERLGNDPAALDTLLTRPPPAGAKPAPGDAPDFDPSWVTIGRDGTLQLALGAPKDAVERYAAYKQWEQRRLYELLTSPGKFLEPVLSPKLKEVEDRNKAIQEESREREENAILAAACNKHREVLYVGGDAQRGLTPLGQQVYDMVEAVAHDRRQAAEIVERIAGMSSRLQPKADGKKLSARAGRVPQAGPPSQPNQAEIDKRLQRPGELAKMLAESAARQRAALV